MKSQKSKVKSQKYNLKKAIEFHGHLGPYLVLGILAGELALKRLRCKKYFGIKVIVKGAINKPKSCLIDGIQLSTGCTYGKGNILKKGGNKIEVLFYDLKKNKKISLSFRDKLIGKLNNLKEHRDSVAFANKLLAINPAGLFEVKF